jgi:hypothetical protein
LDAFGAPKQILTCHLLNQDNRFPSDLGFIGLGAGSAFPKEAKALSMPM